MVPRRCMIQATTCTWANSGRRRNQVPKGYPIANQRRYLRLHHVIFLTAFLLPATLLGQSRSVGSIARAVDEHYNRLASLKGTFSEIYKGPGASRTESGSLWLKKPGRMRWEYHEPREKLFLTDSDNAYFYVPGEPQARKTPLKNLDDIRSPLRYLLGKTRLAKEFDALSFAPDIPPLEPGGVV